MLENLVVNTSGMIRLADKKPPIGPKLLLRVATDTGWRLFQGYAIFKDRGQGDAYRVLVPEYGHTDYVTLPEGFEVIHWMPL